MAKIIMVQGTTSDAGKSMIVTGLCRIFRQDGYRVAPFKAQNLTSNGFLTEEGLEMGKAQVLQAEAAGTKAKAIMNPILVKPIAKGKMEVVVKGKEWKSPDGRPYKEHREFFEPMLKGCIDELKKDYDIIVVEGAGSPAEINIKEGDLVNMFIAQMCNAPVLLVGDIERGGVFASLVGTLALLTDDERNLIKGLIINKFRGNEALLKNGVISLEEITKKKVMGIVPFLDVDIEPEDSLSIGKNPVAGDEHYTSDFREKQYDILAEGIRNSINIDEIYNLMGLKER
ncbi:MAG: cobyric acid synthase [Anaerovoracaceae bacterium]